MCRQTVLDLRLTANIDDLCWIGVGYPKVYKVHFSGVIHIDQKVGHWEIKNL